MLRCESLLGLDQATCSRVLNKNYKLLVSMAPLSNEIRPISSCTPQVHTSGGDGQYGELRCQINPHSFHRCICKLTLVCVFLFVYTLVICVTMCGLFKGSQPAVAPNNPIAQTMGMGGL